MPDRKPLADQIPMLEREEPQEGPPEAAQSVQEASQGQVSPMTPGTALEPSEGAGPPAKWGTGAGIAWLAELERIAAATAKAVTTPEALGRDPRNVLAVMLTGREIGIGPMESLRLIHIVKGTPVLAAELKVKLARRAGHRIQLIEGDEKAVTVRGTRCDSEEQHTVTWRLEDAQRAGLVKAGGAWTTYPRPMLWARAVSQLIRELMPDVTGASLYSAEEVSDEATGL